MTPRILALLATFAFASSTLAGDWPQWRGPNRDGKSSDENLLKQWPKDGPKLLWQVQSLDIVGTGYGSPAVVGDRLYIMGGSNAKQTAEEFCTCLSVKDGSKIWQTKFSTTNGNYSDGWGGGPRSTPTVTDTSIYVLGSTGDLFCLNREDGIEVWKTNLVKEWGGAIPNWGYSESPLVDDGKVIVTPGNDGGMLALDAKTGKKVWQCSEFKGKAGYSSVVIAEVSGVKQYVQQTMESGVGVRAKDGKLLWNVGGIGRRTAVIPTPIIYQDKVFFTAGYGAGCELFELKSDGSDMTKADEVYTKNKVMSNKTGGVIQIGENIYGHNDREWVCFPFLTGSEDATWTQGRFGKGSITYADGELYLLEEDSGTLAKIEATDNDWTEVGRFKLPKLSPTRPGSGKVWPHPVVANGKLYVRDYEYLYCYDVSGK